MAERELMIKMTPGGCSALEKATAGLKAQKTTLEGAPALPWLSESTAGPVVPWGASGSVRKKILEDHANKIKKR